MLFGNCIAPVHTVRNLWVMLDSNMTQPLARLSIGRCAFSVCAPSLWDHCPCHSEVRLLFLHSNGPSKLATFKHWLHPDPLRLPGPQIRLWVDICLFIYRLKFFDFFLFKLTSLNIGAYKFVYYYEYYYDNVSTWLAHLPELLFPTLADPSIGEDLVCWIKTSLGACIGS